MPPRNLLALALLQFAAASLVTFDPPESGWRPLADTAVSRAHPVAFTIVLAQTNLDELYATARDVSTPGHARYGAHLSVDAIAALTAPPAGAVSTVASWLREHGLTFTVERECIFVRSSVRAAEALLRTSFGVYVDEAGDGERRAVRASSYTLPAHVAAVTATVLGLHGLPLPLVGGPNPLPAQPAKVTPTVLYQTYNVGSPSVNRSSPNKQAVAEFQGQYMIKSDLQKFFKALSPPGAQPGDENVHAFKGVPYKEGQGVEAALDIQYIMGVSAGVKTEFWEWPATDFCADLLNFTHTLLQPGGPNVMSISYGWQGDLARVGCTAPDVAAIDTNWAKLAAAGVSVIISSGDSGSGYSGGSSCDAKDLKYGLEVAEGEVAMSGNYPLFACCSISKLQHGYKAFTWRPPPRAAAAAPSARKWGEVAAVEGALRAKRASAAVEEEEAEVAATTVEEAEAGAAAVPAGWYHFKHDPFHVVESADPDLFPMRDVHYLNGLLTKKGGTVQLHDANGTFADTTIAFGAPYKLNKYLIYRNLTMTIQGGTVEGRATFLTAPTVECESLYWFNDTAAQAAARGAGIHGSLALLRAGANPPPPPPAGNCTFYSSVTKTAKADKSIVSGGPSIAPSKVVLYPSWPASSPWVTAVGATRFCNQTIGHEEMASDQFGSGGGFSAQFNQSHAAWQADFVAAYVAQGASLPKFPPSGSFPPLGRATPDVSALGEGYQVYEDGKVQSVGGTSASAPAFAGFVSLINEARVKAGKPPMGFLNPFLYANGKTGFTDITKGTNAIGRGTGPVAYGFAAAPGWDPATGLGTPKFDKLLAAALKPSVPL